MMRALQSASHKATAWYSCCCLFDSIQGLVVGLHIIHLDDVKMTISHQDYGGVHMGLLTCAFDACSKLLLSREDEEVSGTCMLRADAALSDGEAAAECMG